MRWLRGRHAAPPAVQESVPPQVRATEADLSRAYRLILGREPDADGLRHYTERLRDGLPLNELVESLLGSAEYRERAARQAVRTGDETADHRPAADPDAGDAAGDRINPADLMATYSVEELIATAEEYYRRVDDPAPLMSKPWSFLHETPEMLENLGRLLHGLQLGKTMSVLDFGAGTCWLSRCLAQLNCQVVCCDASTSALKIGARLFAEYPLIGTAVYAPTFLPFDGHRIDLEDESVDRIICFDAFHHIPNQEEVLAEFGRVLTVGGIVGFSEPGPRHSHSPQSQYEMRHHRVLENDIVLAEILDTARRVGFTDMTVSALIDADIDGPQYASVVAGEMDDALRDTLCERLRETVTRRSIFFLHKGPVRFDSRRHVGLSHSLAANASEYVLAGNEDLNIDLVIANTGEARWLHDNVEIFGIVRVGTHLYDASGTLLDLDYSRHALPCDVEPGQESRIRITVPFPFTETHVLKVDLVAEGVSWFENVGSTPAVISVRRAQA